MFVTLTIRNPFYGPQGQPYCVQARHAERIDASHHWTEAEAMEARDAAFNAGARAVHVAGLPTRLAATAPDHPPQLPDIRD